MERPIECSHCKRNIKVIYQDIQLHESTEIGMCSKCPILNKKLHGTQGKSITNPSITTKENVQTLHCGNCETSQEALQTGEGLGCSECYVVFEELILQDLLQANKIGSRVRSAFSRKKYVSLHIGKTPHQPKEITLSKRLQELTEALNEALKGENYEQAAWLRDQIQEIIGK